MLSTPILTNAGRFNYPLSACSVPPIHLMSDLQCLKQYVDNYHQQGMGTGFDFSKMEDPVQVMRYLNDVAYEGSISGKELRPVGNMGTLSVYHPKIMEFIHVKVGADDRDEHWIFNISVTVDDLFMEAVTSNSEYLLFDGSALNAADVFAEIAASAHHCGDPGLIFIDHMNKYNPTPDFPYVTTAPCAEVGLAEGETCQFGSVNLSRCLKRTGDGYYFSYQELQDIVTLLVTVLDNAVQISIGRYTDVSSYNIMSQKRKIGIGICGLADSLALMNIPYNSSEGVKRTQAIIERLNYYSKKASHELAHMRGSFLAFDRSSYGKNRGYLADRFSREGSRLPVGCWENLGMAINEEGMMRHASTVALPPTGRCALVFDASSGIEPYFRLSLQTPGLLDKIKALRWSVFEMIVVFSTIIQSGSIQNTHLPQSMKEVYRTATEMEPRAHLDMSCSSQEFVDDSISKTINMPNGSTCEEICDVYRYAHERGAKGVTIYRAESKKNQPVLLLSNGSNSQRESDNIVEISGNQYEVGSEEFRMCAEIFCFSLSIPRSLSFKAIFYWRLLAGLFGQSSHLKSEYILEKQDPLHRIWHDGPGLDIFKQWKESSSAIGFFPWLHSKGLDKLPIPRVKYFTDKECEHYCVVVDEQRTLRHLESGQIVEEGEYLYVLNKKKQIFLAQDNEHLGGLEQIQHSSFSGDGPVVCAGLLRVERGEIVTIDNSSGHYKPMLYSLRRAIDILFSDRSDRCARKYPYYMHGELFSGDYHDVVRQAQVELGGVCAGRG